MEEKYMKSKKIIMITMCFLICIMAIGYAAFATNLTINGTANITSTWKVLFTKIEEVSKTSGVTITKVPTAEGTNATFNVDLTSPGDKIVYKITVENQGTLDAIINDITASETGSDAIKFGISGIKKGDKLATSAATTFSVTISYDISITSQPATTNNTLTVNIDYVQDLGQTVVDEDLVIHGPKLVARILSDNKAQSDTNIDFSQVSSDTNGKGLYYTSTNTEDNKVTYYFRGVVENNYVKFGGTQEEVCTYGGFNVDFWDENNNIIDNPIITKELCQSTNVCLEYQNNELMYADVGLTEASCIALNNDENYNNDGMKAVWTNRKAVFSRKVNDSMLWRIIRINEDGSIRIITQDSVGTSPFSSRYGDAAYVGYVYGTPGSTTYEATHTNESGSTIEQFLGNIWHRNFANYSSLIADSGFCGDRSIASSANTWATDDTALGYGKNKTYYGTNNRLWNNKIPQFACPQSNDLYTTVTSTKGNKALTRPIGLITADEVVYAGGVVGISNKTYYLTNEVDFWTISPCDSSVNPRVYLVTGGGGSLIGTYVDWRNIGVRPVINLKSTVEITSGNGTESNPYVIKTD